MDSSSKYIYILSKILRLKFLFVFQVNHDNETGSLSYSLKSWSPENSTVQDIVAQIQDRFKGDSHTCAWEDNILHGQQSLQVI